MKKNRILQIFAISIVDNKSGELVQEIYYVYYKSGQMRAYSDFYSMPLSCKTFFNLTPAVEGRSSVTDRNGTTVFKILKREVENDDRING